MSDTQRERYEDEYAYIGTKVILAHPMDECTFLKRHKGQDVSNRETRDGYCVQYEDGYVSWSPKETFEKAYRRISSEEAQMARINVV